ncbi:proline--tRNA ligase [bacterium]|nr:MAG: proline--tRNA ligase [bacterium]
MSKNMTTQKENFSSWYTDVVTKAGLADYGPVKGTMVIMPYGFELWDLVKNVLDKMIKETGHVNAYFPIFIPKSYLAKEAEHIDGFAKECAVVTHTRLKSDENGDINVDPSSRLEEEVIVRPTSETIIWSMYKKWIQSYRDLPLLINQWANVVRWEMRTRLFLRTSEFLWQEGHTAHATAEEAEEETLKILDLYKCLAEDYLAMPVLTGLKTEAEKFAGAEKTYCIEAMMGDKKALQAGTSHNLGQNFAKAFGVTFQNDKNEEELVFATSWGVSTRLVGAIIMTHGDENGLRLPPKIAPIQVVVVPIFKDEDQKKAIKNFIMNQIQDLKNENIRIYVDWSDKRPGSKFNHWELKGVPIRIEIGQRDILNEELVLYRRDKNEKSNIKIDDFVNIVKKTLRDIQTNLFTEAKNFQVKNTHNVRNFDEFKTVIENEGGFIKCGWDGTSETETRIKELTKATIRVIPFEQDIDQLKCIYSNKKAKYEVIFAKAY